MDPRLRGGDDPGAFDDPRRNPGHPAISADLKQDLRRVAAVRRDAAHAEAGPEAAAVLARHGLAFLEAQAGAVVSGFWPMRSEIDVRPLLTLLHGAGRRIALPTITGKDRPLVFHAWQPGDTLAKGPFDTAAPLGDAPALAPDILLVPLLAFDRARHRLGYGGGFYDRTLEALRTLKPIMAVGIAYAAQEIDAVPAEPWDQRLDAVLTERGVV
jgi:5-formyltetrahydrofolate cyclo-ligase